MVEAVTMYKTNDGRIFNDEESANKWDSDVAKAAEIRLMFPNYTKLEGGNYYQLPSELVADGKRKLAKCLRGKYDDKVIDSFVDGTGNILGRYLDDGDSPYYGVWIMFYGIDAQNRMFGQPYYAINPNTAENEVPY